MYTEKTIEVFFTSLQVVSDYSVRQDILNIADNFKQELVSNIDTDLEEGEYLLSLYDHHYAQLEAQYE